MSCFLWVMLEFINIWFGDGKENNLIREMLWYEVVNSFHICGRNFYEWKASLPSGHPITIIINCLYNKGLFRMAWIYVHNKRLSSARTYDKHVLDEVVGDDNAVNLDLYAQKIFH